MNIYLGIILRLCPLIYKEAYLIGQIHTVKSINTLIKDVNHVVTQDNWFHYDDASRYSSEMAHRVMERLVGEERTPSLRLSSMGERCPRSLWASVHSPSVQEKFPAHVRIKFHFGDVIEAMAIALAKAAGHHVTGEQDERIVDGVKGHLDCILDGCVTDVKSVNSMGFQKIKAGEVEGDIFLRSYLDQLDGYLVGSLDDDRVVVKDRAYLWAIDKQMGHMCLYEHKIRPGHIRERIGLYKSIVDLKEPPRCECGTVADGASGNIKLDLKASYNPYKYFCFPNCRTFIYKGGKPVHLVKVVRKPDVLEVDREGKIVYNG